MLFMIRKYIVCLNWLFVGTQTTAVAYLTFNSRKFRLRLLFFEIPRKYPNKIIIFEKI